MRPIDAAGIAAAGASAPRARFSLPSMVPVFAAGAIGLAVIAGAALLAGGRPATLPLPVVVATPAPTNAPSPAPSPTPAGGIPTSFLDHWMGAAPLVAKSTGARHTAELDISPSGLVLTDRTGGASIEALNSSITGDGTSLRLTSNAVGECPTDNSYGYYMWTQSRGGTMLTITSAGDACAGRAAALTGTWYRMGCRAWHADCIGNLEPGTYPSWNFATAPDPVNGWDPVIGALTYTVPAGWTNSHDFAAGYWLEPTPWHDALVQAKGGIDDHDRPIGNGIYVMSMPSAAVQDAEPARPELADPTVGGTADDLVAFLTHHPALDATPPQPIEINGLAGSIVDVQLKSAWTRSCPGLPGPFATTFTYKGGTPSTVWNDTGTNARHEGPVHRARLFGQGRPLVIQISAPSSAELRRAPAQRDAGGGDLPLPALRRRPIKGETMRPWFAMSGVGRIVVVAASFALASCTASAPAATPSSRRPCRVDLAAPPHRPWRPRRPSRPRRRPRRPRRSVACRRRR